MKIRARSALLIAAVATVAVVVPSQALDVVEYTIDLNHSAVEFKVRHLGISMVSGRFDTFSGVFNFDPDDPSASSVSVTIDAASINTRNESRDDHLRSEDFLHVTEHSELTFVSTTTRDIGEGFYEIDGDLTIRGVTQSVTLGAELGGMVERENRGAMVQSAAFSATTRINREDFGLVWNRTLETGGFLVGQEVRISIEIEAHYRPESAE